MTFAYGSVCGCREVAGYRISISVCPNQVQSVLPSSVTQSVAVLPGGRFAEDFCGLSQHCQSVSDPEVCSSDASTVLLVVPEGGRSLASIANGGTPQFTSEVVYSRLTCQEIMPEKINGCQSSGAVATSRPCSARCRITVNSLTHAMGFSSIHLQIKT